GAHRRRRAGPRFRHHRLGNFLRHLEARAARLLRRTPVTDEAAPERGRVWGTIVAVNDKLWAQPQHIVELVGDHMLLLGRAFFWLFKPPFRWSTFVEASEFIGVQSILIVILIGMFVGMVFALQLTSSLRAFGAESFVGATLGLALTRELAPVFTSIVVAARAG